MMISEAISAKLNEQTTAEFEASHKYLAMACALDQMGMKILSKWFVRQAAEEREHAMQFIEYLQQVGASVVLDAVPKPKEKNRTVKEIVQAALDSELVITQRINELAALCETENDYATRSFVNKFVDEQVEEVATMTDLLEMVELAGDNLLQIEMHLQYEMTAKG